MAIEWFRNAYAALAMFVVAAAASSLLLTLTRGSWPPTEPRFRVGRAVLAAVFLGGAAYFAAWHGAGETFATALAPPVLGHQPYLLLRPLILLLAAVFFGGLIPAVIEGRSLAAMGWVRHHAWVYGGLAVLAGVASRVLAHPPPVGTEFMTGPDAHLLRPDVFLRQMPLSFVGLMLAEGLVVAFMEENLFRGHLMLALREAGHRGAVANHLQAALFAVCHPYVVVFWADATHRSQLPAVYPILYLFGLLFGWLRWRTGSIVPGFVFHAIGNTVYFIFWFGAMAAWMNSIGHIG